MDFEVKDNFYKLVVLVAIGLITVLMCPVPIVAWTITILLVAFFVSRWVIYAIQIVISRRWHKHYERFRWYTDIGLVESGCILEPKHSNEYWLKLLKGILK